MILVTGASGQLGNAFRRILPDPVCPPLSAFDLARPDQMVATLEGLAPTSIINCAAYTAVDRAEVEENGAVALNAVAVGLIAEYSASREIPFVTFSTDYVFGGNSTVPYVESDRPAPVNAYGRSKLLGEQATLAAHPGALIVRTSWVISPGHSNFVASILEAAVTQDGIDVVADQTGCPTVADDLAVATMAALAAGATGLLHLANDGATTWFELARTALREAGLDPRRVRPVATELRPGQARRPSFSALGSERREALGITMPHWRESLPAVVAGLRPVA